MKVRTILPPASLEYIPTMLSIVDKLDVRVQQAFAPLIQAYRDGIDWYDESMDFTGFNFRYPSHPFTNLSEMLAMHWLVQDPTVLDVRVEMEKDGQVSGVDLVVETMSGMQLINVKMADMYPIGTDGNEARSFEVHREVYAKLKTQYKQCDKVILVDVARLSVFAFDTARFEEDGLTSADDLGYKRRWFYDYFVNSSKYCAEKLKGLE